MKKTNTTLLYCFLFLATFLGIQSTTEAQVPAEVRAEMQTILDSNLPGLVGISSVENLFFGGVSACLIGPDGAFATAHIRDASIGIPVDSTFRFGLSDASQLVLATLAFAMVEEGTLSLSQTVSQFNLGASLTNVPGSITVGELLSHKSGLANFADDSDYISTLLFDVNRVFTPAEITSLFVGSAGSTGSFSYSNTNYLVLGLILDDANGNETLQESIDRLIQTPAGITGLELYGTMDPANFANGFADVFGTGFPQQLTPNISVMTGASFAGNSLATAIETSIFMQELVDGNVIPAGRVGEMTAFSNSSGRVGPRYAFGIEEVELMVNGEMRTYIGHYGDLNYKSVVLYDPTRDVGVTILGNNQVISIDGFFDVAAELLALGDDLIVSIDPTVFDQADFKVFPNPASDQLSVQFELLETALVNVSVHNLMGQQVYQARENMVAGLHTEPIQVNDLAAGVYFLNVEINGQVATQKFIVE